MTLVNSLLDAIKIHFRSTSRFKINTAVQHICGGPLMVVSKFVYPNRDKVPTIRCQWYDREQNTTMTRDFSECELKEYDWFHPDV
jgi:uncharacterized protein YodC (DUF2158 family)